jgi:hypothetical protein|tara:strand:+ start:2128 stop:2265 length:138 start_codon:yes stop_codon:yes gene_type:complete
MTPDRIETVNGKKIEEFYWNGRMIVYVNNTKTEDNFETAIENAKD